MPVSMLIRDDVTSEQIEAFAKPDEISLKAALKKAYGDAYA